MKVQPQRLILVHGAPEALGSLARRFSKMKVLIPIVGESIEITPSRTLPLKTVADVSPLPLQTGIIQTNSIASNTATKAPPTIEALWKHANACGPLRPWTSVELGQGYYGSAYRPVMRQEIELVLKEASPYFKIGRLGATPTYLPRKPQEVEHLRPLTQLGQGEVVLVQGKKGAPSQLALLLSVPQEGTVKLLTDQWKAATRPMNVIQLLPGLQRPDLLALSLEEAKRVLQQWRRKIDEIWIDLFVLWKKCQGQSFTYNEFMRTLPSEDLRLAWGLELLMHSDELFRREGQTWVPLTEQQIRSNKGFLHHLELLDVGANAPVLVNGQHGRLTGKSNLRLFEVLWEEGEYVGELTRVRSGNIQLEHTANPIPEENEAWGNEDP
jgi:hypothetical protein